MLLSQKPCNLQCQKLDEFQPSLLPSPAPSEEDDTRIDEGLGVFSKLPNELILKICEYVVLPSHVSACYTVASHNEEIPKGGKSMENAVFWNRDLNSFASSSSYLYTLIGTKYKLQYRQTPNSLLHQQLSQPQLFYSSLKSISVDSQDFELYTFLNLAAKIIHLLPTNVDLRVTLYCSFNLDFLATAFLNRITDLHLIIPPYFDPKTLNRLRAGLAKGILKRLAISCWDQCWISVLAAWNFSRVINDILNFNRHSIEIMEARDFNYSLNLDLQCLTNLRALQFTASSVFNGVDISKLKTLRLNDLDFDKNIVSDLPSLIELEILNIDANLNGTTDNLEDWVFNKMHLLSFLITHTPSLDTLTFQSLCRLSTRQYILTYLSIPFPLLHIQFYNSESYKESSFQHHRNMHHPFYLPLSLDVCGSSARTVSVTLEPFEFLDTLDIFKFCSRQIPHTTVRYLTIHAEFPRAMQTELYSLHEHDFRTSALCQYLFDKTNSISNKTALELVSDLFVENNLDSDSLTVNRLEKSQILNACEVIQKEQELSQLETKIENDVWMWKESNGIWRTNLMVRIDLMKIAKIHLE